MGSTPQFASTVLVGHATPSATADAVYTAPAHAILLCSAPAGNAAPASAGVAGLTGNQGIKIEEIDVVATGVTVAGNMNIYMYDQTAYWLVDSFLLTVVTPSTTVAPLMLSHTYQNLIVPPNSALYISSIVASQLAIVNAYGAYF